MNSERLDNNRLVCRLCGKKYDYFAPTKCKVDEDGEHHFVEVCRLVCRFCGEKYDDSAHNMCMDAADGKHHFVEVCPYTVIRVETLYCELCGKEWKSESKCELTKNGSHKYRVAVVEFQKLPLENQSILKEGS